jgi:hypothetical protein
MLIFIYIYINSKNMIKVNHMNNTQSQYKIIYFKMVEV